MVEAASPQAVGQPGLQVIVPFGVQPVHSAVAGHAFVASPPQESVQVLIVEVARPQAVGQPGSQVIVPFGTQSQSAALQATDSVRAVAVVFLPSVVVHSSPPLAGAGLLHVLVFVPDVPHAVALQAPHSLHPPSTPHAAVAGQDLVVATPHELVHVDIVDAA